MNLSQFANASLKKIKSNSPEILTALGVSGVITTSYLAAKAGFRSVEVIEQEKVKFRNTGETRFGPVPKDQDDILTTKQKVQLLWKCYIPPAISATATIGCIIGASRVTGRRTAAAVTAYSLTERAFAEYREKVVDQIGKGKEQKIRDELAQEHVTNRPPKSREVIITSGGNVLCCELFTHRYFRSDIEALRRAMNDTNALIVHEHYVTLEEFYDIIGLPHTSISDKIGWDSTKLMELEFSTVLSEEGEPCLAFEYNYTKPLR